jgi:hypothetical protein
MPQETPVVDRRSVATKRHIEEGPASFPRERGRLLYRNNGSPRGAARATTSIIGARCDTLSTA